MHDITSGWRQGIFHLIAVGPVRHHTHLKSLGASKTYDHNDSDFVAWLQRDLDSVPYFFDSSGAVLLPVIFSPPTPTSAPEHGLGVDAVADWANGVQTSGVRTPDYENNEELARVLQPVIIPALIANGAVLANQYRVVEGHDLLERAENALTALKEGGSGEKLIWRVATT